MKKSLLSLIVLLIVSSYSLKAQNLIAVQSSGNTSFYTSLDDAIANAINGDNIYVPGGSFTINNPISKEVHIVGAGANPDSTIATGFTLILSNIILVNGSSNSSIEGLYLNNYNIYFGTNPQNISGVIISRCNVGSITFICDNTQARYQNIIIKESIINNAINTNQCYGNYCIYNDIQNCVVSNNIIYYIQQLNLNCQIKNNIILSSTTLNGCNIFNNIIYYSGANCNINNCTFRNNLILDGAIVNVYGQSGQTNMFLNNIDNQQSNSNTTFINAHYGQFGYTYDYHLQSSCPGKNAGTDGTDVGIYGGQYPWKDGSIPVNPHIINSTIGGVTNTNGALPVNIKVSAQDH